MKEIYHYTDKEIGEKETDRFSYFCFPISDGNCNIYGIIYFDSGIKNIFQDLNHDLVRKIIEHLKMVNYDIIDLQNEIIQE